MTSPVTKATEPVVITVVPAQKQTVKVRPDALHKLQLPPGPPEQAVGLKKGKNLLLRFADQGELLLEDFFDPASGQAQLELVSQSGEPLLLQPNSVGIALADGQELVFVYGDRSTLGAWLAEEPGFNAALQEVFGSAAAQEWAGWIAPSGEAGGLVAVAPLAFGPIAGGVGAGALAAAAAGGGGGDGPSGADEAPVITVDRVTADNTINAGEAANGFNVSGTTTAEVGQTVSVWVSGNPSVIKTATVVAGADGLNTWQTRFTATELPLDTEGRIAQGAIAFEASVQDTAGNEGVGYGDDATVDTVAETPSITSSVPTELNLRELTSGVFAVGGDVAEDGTITVSWQDANGNVLLSQTGPAVDGTWSLSFNAGDIPKSGVKLSVTFQDAHQNTSTPQNFDVKVFSTVSVKSDAVSVSATGAETFQFMNAAASGSAYAIEKFNIAEGDKLHISDLLTDFTAGVSDWSEWVSLATDAANNKAVLTIDIDGAGAGTAGHLINLQSIDLTAYSVSRLVTDGVIF